MSTENPTLEGIFEAFPNLENAYYRLRCLDLNGAEIMATEIEDAWHYGLGCQEVADELTESIHATCEAIKRECE